MTVLELFHELLCLIEDGRGSCEIKFDDGAEILSVKERVEPATPYHPDWEVWYEISKEEEEV